MSGVTSTLWRTSLCGVVLALSVLGTGCAFDAGEAEDDVGMVQEDLTISLPAKLTGGLQTPKGPVSNPLTKKSTQTKSPTSAFDAVAEPEPEPWHPDGRGSSTDPNPDDVATSTTPGRSDDHK